MLKQEIIIQNKLGLHARACAKLTKLTNKFNCEIWIIKGEKRVNAKSILGIMMLAAGIGNKITIETNGEQENKAMQEIIQLINNKFDEEN